MEGFCNVAINLGADFPLFSVNEVEEDEAIALSLSGGDNIFAFSSKKQIITPKKKERKKVPLAQL